MRWVLLAAVVICAVLLFLLRDDNAGRHDALSHGVPQSRVDVRREQPEQNGGPKQAGNKRATPRANSSADAAWGDDLSAAYQSHLAPMVDVVVQVLFADGTPARGATVQHSTNPVDPWFAHKSTTGDDGTVKLTSSWGVAWFSARRGLLASAPKHDGFGGKWPDSKPIKLVLQAEPFVIRGIVLHPDGTPAGPDVTVRVRYSDGVAWRSQKGYANKGKFQCFPIPRSWAKHVRIDATKRKFPRNEFEFVEPTTDLTLQLRWETVRGHVYHADGTPARLAKIHTGTAAYKTDSKGRFEATFRRREGALLRVNKMIRVLKADDRDIVVVLKPGKPLHGRLLTHDRKPVVAASIKLSLPLGASLASSGTDRDGRFQFLSLAEGPHTLRFELRAGLANLPYYFLTDVHATDRLLEVVMPKPIATRIRLRGDEGRALASAKHVSLFVERGGRLIYERNWPRESGMDVLPLILWEAGVYHFVVHSSTHDSARLLSRRVNEQGPNSFDLRLRKARVRPVAGSRKADSD